MAVVRLSGGLGNQLFQAAFAVAISNEIEVVVGLDVAAYTYSGRCTGRYLEIKHFDNKSFNYVNSAPIVAKIFSRVLPLRMLTKFSASLDLWVKSDHNMKDLQIQREGNLIFDSEICVKGDSYFVGNFMSPQYWGAHESEVLEIIRGGFWESAGMPDVRSETQLNVHARRGDYLSNPKARRFHGICGLQYYLLNIGDMLHKYPEIDSIEIFSDDIRFAIELEKSIWLKYGSIKVNSTVDPKKALAEMTLSKFFIGCNSTFSWWSSVLSPNRVSILPSNWFLDPTRKIDPVRFFIGNVLPSDIPLE